MFGSLTNFENLFDQLRRVEQDMDELFGRWTAPAGIRSISRSAFPATNVGATTNALHVYLFAPGLDAKSFNLSIQQKLVASMVACLAVFVLISSGLTIRLSGDAMRERAVAEDLPVVVNAIRADIQRQLSEPLTASLDIANNAYLLQWESEGLPDTGMDAWKRYAQRMKEQYKAVSVYWVSQATRKYLTEGGATRAMMVSSSGSRFLPSSSSLSLAVPSLPIA